MSNEVEPQYARVTGVLVSCGHCQQRLFRRKFLRDEVPPENALEVLFSKHLGSQIQLLACAACGHIEGFDGSQPVEMEHSEAYLRGDITCLECQTPMTGSTCAACGWTYAAPPVADDGEGPTSDL